MGEFFGFFFPTLRTLTFLNINDSLYLIKLIYRFLKRHSF